MAPGLQGLDKDVAQPAPLAKRMLDAIGGRWWNVYIGGPESGGHGWTPALVREYVAHGIDRFMLTYVGRQRRGPLTRDQGVVDGRDAVRIANEFGYSGSFPLCLDIELPTFESAPQAATEYARAWCTTVRGQGARPGIYANPGPLKAMHGIVPADFVWIASWVSHVPGPRDPHAATGMPPELWPNPSQRAWQYAGATGHVPCHVLGVDVDISVADDGVLAHAPGVEPVRPARSDGGGAVAETQLVRAGDAGQVVAVLTRRLASVRSPRTGKPYLDGARQQLDGAAVAALKAFQADHLLAADGVYGPATAVALLRAVRLEQARQRPAQDKTQVTLVSLADDFRRFDAAAGVAWKKLVAYGRARRPAGVHALGAGPGAAEMSSILTRIDDKLTTLLDIDRNGEASAAPEHAAVAVEAPSPPTAGGDGHAPAPRNLQSLSDDELLREIDLLDLRLDAARSVLVARYAQVEKALAPSTPARPVQGPTTPGAPTPARPSDPAEIPATEDVRDLQRKLNAFAAQFLTGMAPLIVDGKNGPATKARIRLVRYYLGYDGPARASTAVDADFLRRLEHPRSASPAMLARAVARRRAARQHVKRISSPQPGVVMFDGRPVAAWLEPYLTWARGNGWKGTLNSGYRDPAYSEHLCRIKCGRPSCPGTCAGRSSNHVGRIAPAGAMDVSDYFTFATLMRRCPIQPRVFNDLPRDRVHFSATGH